MSTAVPPQDPTAIAAVLELIDNRVWVLTAQAGGRRGGLVTTSPVSASIVPALPRLLVTIGKQHHTWGLIDQGGAFALHMLGEDDLDWVWRFGLRSGRDLDKLDGLPHHAGVGGAPILDDARAWLDCRVEGRLDIGDRTVFLAAVLDGAVRGPFTPLRMSRLLERAAPEQRRALKDSQVHDAALDVPLIQAWRAAQPR